MVNRVFHAAFTLPRCIDKIEALDFAVRLSTVTPSTITEASKTEKVRENFAFCRYSRCDLSCLTATLSGPPTYLRNIERGKSKKKFELSSAG
jgi:hypothetical protein